MAIEAFDTDAFDTDAFSADAFLFSDTGVIVPDVVGLTQAQGTSDLEAELFVVSVATAYSSVVAAGLIISQSPAGGVEYPEGGTVTITVSLGDVPITDTQTSGGWSNLFDLERNKQKRKKRLKEMEEAEQTANKVDAEIAKHLHDQELKDDGKEELKRLHSLVKKYSKQIQSDLNAERVNKALALAEERQSLASFEQLQREIEHAEEEEYYLLMLLL